MFPGINILFNPIANATGASVDDLKQVFCFLVSFPLAAVLKRIPDSKPSQKNAFIVAVSLFYFVGVFDLWDGLRTYLYSAVATYALAYYVDGSLMPWLVLMFLFGHMSISHIARQRLNDPTVVDITGGQMVLVMKLSAFAWNVHDGRLDPKWLTDYQKDRAVYKMPGLLNYAAYVFFFPSVLIGPAFDYVDYERWLNTSMFDVPKDAKTPPKVHGKRRIPHSSIPATYKAIGGLLWIFLYLQLSGWYNPPFVLSSAFTEYSFPRRVWTLYALGFTSRLKYYGAWSLTEGACILSGIGYAGLSPSGTPMWNKLENVNAWNLETAQNSHAYLDNWNKNTNKWLRYYIYLRVTPKGKKPGFRATLATFATSALWHGFYPGYYLTFILGAFIQNVAKNFRRYVRPFFLTPDGTKPTKYKMYYDVASWFVTQLAFSFTTAPFVILGFNDSLRVWARVYFYTIAGVVACMAFFASPAKPYLISRLDKRNHPYLRRTISQEKNYPPTLGLPNDPAREIDEAIEEIRTDIEARRRRGSTVQMPSGLDLKRAVESKIGKSLPDLSAWTGQQAEKAKGDRVLSASGRDIR